MFAATGYELFQMREAFALDDSLLFGVGFVISFVVALMAVKGFVSFLGRGSLAPFGWYRILIAPVFYFLTRSLSF
jgi:undecaprenyl-diphosphatase